MTTVANETTKPIKNTVPTREAAETPSMAETTAKEATASMPATTKSVTTAAAKNVAGKKSATSAAKKTVAKKSATSATKKTPAKKAAATKTTARKTAAKKAASRSKTLLIVESPSKAKIIGKYLGSSYKVIASVGHVRDLPKSRLAVDVDNHFEPEYINIRGKAPVINEMKKEAASAKKVLLATDPDREGEAISWHIAYLLGIDPNSPCRIEFNEINKDAVKEAIQHPRPINMGLVDAQQARRVLDRLVGYQISPLLWKKVRRGLSAGRVQSAALKIICDRENEIQNFIPEEYWHVFADFGNQFKAQVVKRNGKKLVVPDEAAATKVRQDLTGSRFEVTGIVRKDKKTNPYPPFTTSTLQQDASNRLNFQTRRTMQIAQQLYEGVDIKGLGSRGLVTYIRTDSVRISDGARAQAQEYIRNMMGSEYVGSGKFANKKNKDIQDAHEAIRPSDINLNPEDLKDSLTLDQYKLYRLIWQRFVASQMAPAVSDTVTVAIESGDYELKASGSTPKFAGWRKVYNSSSNDEPMNIPPLKEGEVLNAQNIETVQKFTTPPPRYTEASLVKTMEEQNIGRPSTYATIITTLGARRYIKRDKKSLLPTQLGFDVTKILSEYFADIVDVQFTGQMEDNLDSVELKKLPWKDTIEDFYGNFRKELECAEQEVERIEQEVVLSDEVCELCGRPMAIKEGRFGRFLACTGYPECKNTKAIQIKVGVKCPLCGKDLVQKRSKKGRIFYGCSGYPDCNITFWSRPVDKKCPKCGSLLVENNTKKFRYKCSNAECDYREE